MEEQDKFYYPPFKLVKDKMRHFNEGTNLAEFHDFLDANYKSAPNKQLQRRCLNLIGGLIRHYDNGLDTIVYVEDIIKDFYLTGYTKRNCGTKTFILMVNLLEQYKQQKSSIQPANQPEF